ncbi:MAG: prolyl oligopeptidase family serine peptidase [Bacteroidales bacterium]
MKHNILLLILSAFIVMTVVSCKKHHFEYPETKKVDTVDTYFGTEVPDPYRWLENDTSQEVKEWVEAQNEVTFNYLEQIPFRSKIYDRTEELRDYPRMSAPNKVGDKYFFFKNEGLQDHSVLYMTEDLDEEPEVVIDPNKMSEDGSVSLAQYKVSNDEQYIAYAISKGGSDWREVFVKNLETNEKLDDHIKWVKFSNIAWYKDGFFYSKFETPEEGSELSAVNKNHKVYYHKLGTSPDKDELVFQNPKYPERNYTTDVSKDEKYLYIYETRSTHGNNVYIKNLQTDKDFVKLTTGFKYEYDIIGHEGDKLIVHTNYNAPKYKVVKIDVHKRDVGNWIEVIPEKEDLLQRCQIGKDKIIASYLKDAKNNVKVYTNDGEYLYNLDLPALGSVNSISANQDSKEVFYAFSSYTIPREIWKHNLNSKETEVLYKPEVKFDQEDYVTEQVFYESKDDTKIPMFLTYKKGMKKDGNNPVMLYGYGGFNISLTPSFSSNNMIWLENGGIYAVANIRGGGEYGERWHKQGMRLNKMNVFNDFIAAAEYLIEDNYTNNEKIAIQGGSNGGLLVGAVVNKRPDLFEVAIPAVGVMDMLRFHKFTIGRAWVDEYGSSEDSLEFQNLINYSPLHNIESGIDYPAILAMTADHDDRVVPAHSFKYIATLQEKYDGNNPTMIRIQTKAGHGAGKAVSVKNQEEADKWSFIFDNMDMKPSY